MFKNISVTLKKILSVIIILFFIFLIISLFFVDVKSQSTLFIIGLSLGTLSSILKIYLAEQTFNKMVDLPQEKATNKFKFYYLIKTFITGAVFLITILISLPTFFGASIGALFLPISSYIVGFTVKNTDPK